LLKCEDIYEDIDYKVMVYEYCNMGSLHAEIERRGKTPTDQVRAIIILKQVLSALKVGYFSCRVCTRTAMCCTRTSNRRISLLRTDCTSLSILGCRE
jgi:serine/threonine protein kinase